MKISADMQKALNVQIREELDSAQLYDAMAACFDAQNLDGFANWMKLQAEEERGHARRFYDYLFERGGRAYLPGIKEPQSEWASPLEAFRAAYAHEQHISSCIHALVRRAREEGDFATESMLQWFVDEQVEEEDQALRAVEKLERFGGSPEGLYLLDREFGERKAGG